MYVIEKTKKKTACTHKVKQHRNQPQNQATENLRYDTNKTVLSLLVARCMMQIFIRLFPYRMGGKTRYQRKIYRPICMRLPIIKTLAFLAHLSQSLIGELTDYPWSGVRRRPSTISNDFSSETAWPIKAKFYVEPCCEGGMKVYINGSGHMTKMAAMPIYGKTL